MGRSLPKMTTLATKTGPKQLGGVPRWSLAVSGPHTALASGQTIPAVAAEVPIGFAEVPIGAAEGPIGSAVDTVTAELGRAEEGTADKRTDTPEEGPVQRRQHRDYRAVMAQRPDLLGAVTAGMTGEVAADKRADTPEEAPLRRRQQRDYRAMMARRSCSHHLVVCCPTSAAAALSPYGCPLHSSSKRSAARHPQEVGSQKWVDTTTKPKRW
mmetsp:Transcript_28479/g.45962  ORF Transcript_28479/g.45962 Transcript_28479/m.45962 type:complete len:212 (-) Transcript_28479:551-1186(-)